MNSRHDTLSIEQSRWISVLMQLSENPNELVPLDYTPQKFTHGVWTYTRKGWIEVEFDSEQAKLEFYLRWGDYL